MYISKLCDSEIKKKNKKKTNVKGNLNMKKFGQA